MQNLYDTSEHFASAGNVKIQMIRQMVGEWNGSGCWKNWTYAETLAGMTVNSSITIVRPHFKMSKADQLFLSTFKIKIGDVKHCGVCTSKQWRAVSFG